MSSTSPSRRIGVSASIFAAQLVVQKRRERGRLDRADGDRVHPHRRRELGGQLARHERERGLRRAVGDEARLRRRRPAADEMFTIAPPPPASSMCGTARRVSRKAVVTLKWKRRLEHRSLVWSAGGGGEPPALFTTMSMRPNSSTRRVARAPRAAPRSFTSQRHRERAAAELADRSRRPPRAAPACAPRTRRRRPARRTRARSRAPMPRPAPVTIATRSVRRKRSSIIAASSREREAYRDVAAPGARSLRCDAARHAGARLGRIPRPARARLCRQAARDAADPGARARGAAGRRSARRAVDRRGSRRSRSRATCC